MFIESKYRQAIDRRQPHIQQRQLGMRDEAKNSARGWVIDEFRGWQRSWRPLVQVPFRVKLKGLQKATQEVGAKQEFLVWNRKCLRRRCAESNAYRRSCYRSQAAIRFDVKRGVKGQYRRRTAGIAALVDHKQNISRQPQAHGISTARFTSGGKWRPGNWSQRSVGIDVKSGNCIGTRIYRVQQSAVLIDDYILVGVIRPEFYGCILDSSALRKKRRAHNLG